MKRALCIGLNYTGSPYELPDCDIDARELAERAGREYRSAFLRKETYAVRTFIADINGFQSITKKTDTTLITFSGHGTQWAEPINSEKDITREGLCFWNGKEIEVLPDDDFRHLLEWIPGTVIVLLDSCYSGGMDKMAGSPRLSGNWQKKFIPFDDDFKVVRVQPSLSRAVKGANRMYFMFACGKNEVSWSTGNGGLFTKSFCGAYDRWRLQRTVKNVVSAAKKECVPDQTPRYEVIGGIANKKIF